jgi:hypothetical protein
MTQNFQGTQLELSMDVVVAIGIRCSMPHVQPYGASP